MPFLKTGLLILSGVYIYATGAYAMEPAQEPSVIVNVQLVDDIGASERVEAAAILRVLSQEVASAACHMSHGIDAHDSRKLLTEAKLKFTLILDALQHGNPNMNIIGSEERRKTINKIEHLRAEWAPIKAAAIALLEDPNNAEALTLIKAENEAVMATTFDLASELAGQYSNPVELLQVDVMLLDFSGRQALLTQKLAKVACEIWSGNRAEDRIEMLSATMQTYDMTLMALHDGMPAVGIPAAPTPEISTALANARQNWEVIKPKLEQIASHDEVSDEDKTELYKLLNHAMYEMEAIEHLYVTHSKHKYN